MITINIMMNDLININGYINVLEIQLEKNIIDLAKNKKLKDHYGNFNLKLNFEILNWYAIMETMLSDNNYPRYNEFKDMLKKGINTKILSKLIIENPMDYTLLLPYINNGINLQ